MPHKDPRGHVEFLQASELNSASYTFGDLSPGLRAFELVGTPSCDSTLLVTDPLYGSSTRMLCSVQMLKY